MQYLITVVEIAAIFLCSTAMLGCCGIGDEPDSSDSALNLTRPNPWPIIEGKVTSADQSHFVFKYTSNGLTITKTILLCDDAKGSSLNLVAGQALKIGVFLETTDGVYPKWIQDVATGESYWFNYE